ncbi:MAG: SPOR domain-containing protein [Halopseudomonas sp.]|uniref:SPOR domain-containing protein n=1 Tax=Halopseudomonas sp. TaxID=2901191 RepID=UPI0030035372
MRSLFLFLLLLNLLYALWQWQIGGWRLFEHDLAREPGTAVTDVAAERASSIAGSGANTTLPDAKQVPGALAESKPALCVMLGTFAERASAEQLQQRLLALDIAAELIAQEEVASTDYWLVMSVKGGAQGAMARLSLLQEKGVDSFVITRGDFAGNLSLGVFSQREYAAARQAQLEAEGYEVSIQTVEKTREQYLLQVPPAARRLLDQAMLSRLRADFPAMQHQYQACDGVAKGSDIP